MQEDHAIVVGINVYPALGNLDGPPNDAREFRNWLVATNGGDVPANQVSTILSADYPPPSTALKANPTVEAVQQAFDGLLELASSNSNSGLGYRVGRRLYLYFAGHGFEPQPEQTALLVANATRARGYHVACRWFADYFRRAGFFDEVLVFMDCCREPMSQIPLSIPPYLAMTATDAPEHGKWLTAHATKWSRSSREKLLGGQSRGVFTTALLKGLAGDGSTTGQITDEWLANYLYDHMKDLLTPAELEDPTIPKQPDILYDKDPANRILITTVTPSRYAASISAPAAAIGQTLTIRDGNFAVVFQGPVSAAPAAAQLPGGFYFVQVLPSGLEAKFQLPGAAQGGAVHVAL